MGTAARLLGALLFVVFVSVIALRPIATNPTVSAAFSDGLFSRQFLFVAPLLLVTALILGLRLRSMGEGRDEPYTVERESRWEQRDATDRDGQETGWDEADGDGEHPDREPASILAGQGGSRNRGFEIEKQPPDARLRDHFEHLQAELGDDETLATDLETFEQVAAEDDDAVIPDHCPQEYCNAVWEGRTVLGVGAGRYERLDDRRVQCLECEAVVTVDG